MIGPDIKITTLDVMDALADDFMSGHSSRASAARSVAYKLVSSGPDNKRPMGEDDIFNLLLGAMISGDEISARSRQREVE